MNNILDKPPRVFSLQLAWETQNEAADDILATMQVGSSFMLATPGLVSPSSHGPTWHGIVTAYLRSAGSMWGLKLRRTPSVSLSKASVCCRP